MVWVVFMVIGLASADLTTDLVAYFPANGNANDESGNGNNGMVNGATLTEDRFGYANSAYYFDGNDNISIPDDPSLRLQTVTLSAWVKPAVDMNDVQQRVIISKEKQGAAGGYYLAYIGDVNGDGAINFKIMSGGMPATGYHSTEHPIDLIAGQWYHIVGTYDGTVRKLYINGVLKRVLLKQSLCFMIRNPLRLGHKLQV